MEVYSFKRRQNNTGVTHNPGYLSPLSSVHQRSLTLDTQVQRQTTPQGNKRHAIGNNETNLLWNQYLVEFTIKKGMNNDKKIKQNQIKFSLATYGRSNRSIS